MIDKAYVKCDGEELIEFFYGIYSKFSTTSKFEVLVLILIVYNYALPRQTDTAESIQTIN
jgi:hypothetical protein